MIQHKDIPDGQLHEPKGVAGAANKTVYVATGAGTGAWRKIKESDIDYSSSASNVFGWNDISDSLYTAGSPRVITATTRTKVTNNAAAVQSTQARLGTLWDTTNNRFNINDLNSSYAMRVSCKITTASAAGTPYAVKFELQSSNGPLVIVAQDFIIKGGGYVNDVSLSVPFYMGSSINNYPLEIYVTPDTNINLYGIGFVLQRLYKET